ncbi:mitochondrial amidoxime-reducing component 1 [Leptinotarsa decemlineata]|uniref:mitochondrial amidoxime-reducing component 1 n=1 Tax=Leptinotarsa decemlineata TaxID=7539 RepID=UPI003D309785
MVFTNAYQHTNLVLVASLTTVVTVLGSYIYRRFKRPKIPKEWRPVAKVKKLYIYPMKSGRRLVVNRAECSKEGLMESEKFDKSFRLRDRCFVVYQEGTLECKTSRHYNKLVLVGVVAYGINSVTFHAPFMENLNMRVPSRRDAREVILRFYKNEPVNILDCGNEAAKWISYCILDKHYGLRLGYNDGAHKRIHLPEIFKDEEDYYQRGISSDSAGLNAFLSAIMLMTQTSVDDVNGKMKNPPVPVESYRPSILVEDKNLQPFEEDNWEWIRIGNVVMKNVIECLRCTTTTIDMETGFERIDNEPLETMKKYRLSKGPAKDPVIGIMLEVHRTGDIAVGDIVYVGKL